MTATRVNPDYAIMNTTYTFSNITINSHANYYLDLGRLDAVPGYVPIGLQLNISGLTNFNFVVAGALQNNGTHMWCRVYNSQSAAVTGSCQATVYWAKA